MAEFMAGQYWGSKLGRHAEDDFYLEEYRQFLDRDARRRMPLASFNSNDVYAKGALVLEMLKKHLGPERFWAAINRYLTRHAYGNATSDDLRQAVLDATGENLRLVLGPVDLPGRAPGVPGGLGDTTPPRALALTVRQTQVDTARADCDRPPLYTTPLVFRAPLAFRVGTAKGDVGRGWCSDRGSRCIRIEGCGRRRRWWCSTRTTPSLKTLRFDQPTPWLATLLHRDPDLWNRSWVIGQLCHPQG